MKRALLAAFVLGSVGWIPAAAQSTATIDIDTASTIPLNPNFSGFHAEVSYTYEYWDYNFNAMALKLNGSWIRYPGGISGDAFNWQTALEDPSWVPQFASTTSAGTLLANSAPRIIGKGGARFIDAANQANLLGMKIIVCANAFTDTPESIGKMAAYAKANGIPVAVWELANEPYNFTSFFSSGLDYVTKMKPFRDAIKAADPNAVVAIFFDDPGRGTSADPPWNKSIAKYATPYWDAVTYHHYPAQSTGAFTQWMADENGILATTTNAYITGYLTPRNPPGTKFLISEFNPSIGGVLPPISLTDGTLYGGVYTAEYIMRMSTVPSLLYVGPASIHATTGVDSSNEHYNQVDAAGAPGGTPFDTSTLNYGYYYNGSAPGAMILNGVLKNAVKSNQTTVTGGVTVPATGAPSNVMPALYAMSYTNAAGGVSVVITNKSAAAHTVAINLNGSAPAGPYPIQYVTGTDPTATNTATITNAVVLQTATSNNPVTVPPYSVLRADLTSPPVATLVTSANYKTGPVAVNELVTAFGTGIAAKALAAQALPLPTSLGNTTISITDSGGTTQLAPLLYVSPGQANFLVPSGVATGAATVKVMVSGSTVLTGSLTVATVAPGLFTSNGNGAGVAAATALRASASGATTPLTFFACQAAALSCVSSPLSLGSSTDTVYVTLYGTGIRGAKSVTAYVAGQSVPVLYAGAQGSFAGLDQVNITIPNSLAGTGEASVYLIADGQMSNVASMKIQ
jgi:uncharacterized protein (TIGR03437 family)